MNQKIIVIGAGISGLVAAYNLQKRGYDATVLEASNRVGGRMATVDVGGFVIDGGAQFLSSGYPVITSLIGELGLASAFVQTSPYVGIVKGGKVRRFRYDNPFSLLKVLGFKDWLSMGIGGYKLQKKIHNLPVNDYSAWAPFDSEDTQQWGKTFYTQGVLDYFLEPMLEAFYFQSPEQTSKALPIALTKFTLEKTKTMTLRGGIELLAREIAKKLDIRFGATVQNVAIKKDEVEVRTAKTRFVAKKVVIATPAPITKTLYTPQNSYEKALINTPYSSTITLAIALKSRLKQKEIDRIYGIWIPKKERKIISAVTIERYKSEDRATHGELLNIMLSGEAGKAMVEMEEKQVVSKILEELELYIPDIANKITLTKLFRWRHAEPLSPIGRAENIRKYREHIAKNTSVYLVGDYMSMPFTEGAAESGLWAALNV